MTDLSDIEEASEESTVLDDKVTFEDGSRAADDIVMEAVGDIERSGALSTRASCRTSRSTSVLMSFISPLYRQLAATAREESSERKSGLCCGSCCDLVRGCIVVNMLNIFLTIWFLVVSIQGINRIFAVLGVVADDDQFVAPQGTFDRSGVIGLVRTSCGIPFALIGIFGAFRFQKYAVLCTAIWYFMDIIPGVLNMCWPNAVVSAFFCYPHVHLFLELWSGTITRENYSTTEQHCCCKICVGGVKNNRDWQTPSCDLSCVSAMS
jgi:hypothetical protein